MKRHITIVHDNYDITYYVLVVTLLTLLQAQEGVILPAFSYQAMLNSQLSLLNNFLPFGPSEVRATSGANIGRQLF